MKKSVLFLTLTSLLLLTGCRDKGKQTTSSSSTDSGSGSQSTTLENEFEDVTRYCYKGKNRKEKITLRFYTETPNVPYIDLTTYFKNFYFLNLDKTKINDNGVYRYQNQNNADIFLQVDINNEIFQVSDLDAICNISQFELNGCFLKTNTVNLFGNLESSFDFRDYGINLRGDEKEAYLPLTTLNNIFTWVMGYYVAYNGKDVYVINEGGEVYDYAAMMNYSTYYDVLEAKRTFAEDEAEFNYKELCFTIDYLQGHPASMNIGRTTLEENGLDVALDAYPRLKQALKSTNVKEYCDAQYLFHRVLMYDGGHSGAAYRMYNGSDYMMKILNSDSLLYEKYNIEEADYDAKVNCYYSVLNQKSSSFNKTGNYYYADKINKIAYIGFDSFEADYTGWQLYYVGLTNEIPTDNDTFGFIYTCLQQAKTDGIEYIVFDITTNGGGDTTALHGALSFLASGNTSMIYKNTVSLEIKKEIGQIDRNLDGQFNSLDNAFDNNFKFGILTSGYSFSCANALPTFAKDLGIAILGEKSGGGSCCVSYYNDAHGISSRVSSYWKLINNSYIEKDEGVEVDYNLKKFNTSYENFFNTATVKAKLAEFYSY